MWPAKESSGHLDSRSSAGGRRFAVVFLSVFQAGGNCASLPGAGGRLLVPGDNRGSLHAPGLLH